MRSNDFFLIEELFDRAFYQAYIAYSLNQMPVGAVGIGDNKIIYSYNKKHIHAEEFLIGCHTWIVTLEPCISCTYLAIRNKVRNIFFAHYSNNGGCSTLINLSSFLKVNINIYGGFKCSKYTLIRQFFNRK